VPVVLRSTDFASLDELFAARGDVAGPVLFQVAAGELAGVLARMRDGDDVCLAGDPPELVRHRQTLLARRTGLDGLTGLTDRATFTRAASAALPGALIAINLDHFKRLNDQHGHAAGDEALVAAAARIRAAVPADAMVARTSGDGFAVALPADRDARARAAAIHAAFRAAPLPDGTALTASLGLCVRTTEASYDELLRHAEGALYAAKARGRDRVVDHGERAREARERDGDLELDGFEDMTRVLADRVAEVISWRGRRVFQGLRDQADVDALTGLATRRYLDRRLPFEVDHAAERGRPLSVGLLDVDHFGQVNKQHGWPTGDKVLAEIAARIRDALRATDWAARYGGEEICIVIDDAAGEAARSALDRVRAAVAARPFETTRGEPLAITVSIGCAELGPGDTVAQLIERASGRLLAAKRSGRDRVVI